MFSLDGEHYLIKVHLSPGADGGDGVDCVLLAKLRHHFRIASGIRRALFTVALSTTKRFGNGVEVWPTVRQSTPSPPSAPGDKWHLDEVVLTIKENIHHLWRAVDQEGNVSYLGAASPR